MCLRNFLAMLFLCLAAVSSFAKGGGKLFVTVINCDSWYPIEGCWLEIVSAEDNRLVCSMQTDKDGKAVSKKLPDGNYFLNNVAMSMGFDNLGQTAFTIAGADEYINGLTSRGNYYFYASGPDKGIVKVTISGTLPKDVLQAVEAFPHVAIASYILKNTYFSYAFPLAPAKDRKSASASKAFKYGLKAKLKSSGAFNFSIAPDFSNDCFAFGYYVDYVLKTCQPKDFKAVCSGKLNLKDSESTQNLISNGQFWLETFWGSQNNLFGGQSIALNEKWKGSDRQIVDGIESSISVSINRKTGKFKIAIASKDAVGVNVQYGYNPKL